MSDAIKNILLKHGIAERRAAETVAMAENYTDCKAQLVVQWRGRSFTTGDPAEFEKDSPEHQILMRMAEYHSAKLKAMESLIEEKTGTTIDKLKEALGAVAALDSQQEDLDEL